jgi:Domain of unknown function (DUF6265)
MRTGRNTRAPALLAIVAIMLGAGAQAQEIDAAAAVPADSTRQAEVRSRSAQVMPFALDQTRHTFDKTDSGGIQRVHVRQDAPDQLAMIRSHLQAIARSFAERDFSAPAHIHGADMPGMAEMTAARPDELTVTYRDIDDGAELTYAATSPLLMDAVHRWFDAQLSDHGRDATTSSPAIGLDALAWLAGTWVIDDGDTRTEEIWTTLSSDLMLGMSRTVRGAKTVSFEFMRIAARKDGVFYIAQPRGKPPVEFPLQSWDGAAAVFVNSGSSDHLRRIIYRNGADGTMAARIEGVNDGKEFAEDYPYRRQSSHRAD